MEENKDYRAYRYGDHLEPGAELKIEHSVSCEDVDISSLITMGAENLEPCAREVSTVNRKPMRLWSRRQSNGKNRQPPRR